MIGTLDFGNAEWCDMGHILCACCIVATSEAVAHVVAPTVPTRAIATGIGTSRNAF